MRGRSRRERGVAAPASVAVLSTAAVVVAGVFYLATGGAADEPAPAPVAIPAATPTPTPQVTPSETAEPTAKPKSKPKRKQPVVRRAATYVEVYNNSGVPGLAARTGREARGAGWQVVGEDNWYGTITASTVYHPPEERPAARLLAEDLGIERIRPAVEPMRFDRLTVILTSDYRGQGR
ncbi:MAG: LytR C-terminal domain-containing protein [Nocardioides sp.]|nr:LytR C-terminal domain-containing protein [Nocardioides sp.]